MVSIAIGGFRLDPTGIGSAASFRLAIDMGTQIARAVVLVVGWSTTAKGVSDRMVG